MAFLVVAAVTEKDTLDIWVNGQRVSTTVCSFFLFDNNIVIIIIVMITERDTSCVGFMPLHDYTYSSRIIQRTPATFLTCDGPLFYEQFASA